MPIDTFTASSVATPTFSEQIGVGDDGIPQYQNDYIFEIETLSYTEISGSDPDRTYVDVELNFHLTQFGWEIENNNWNQAISYIENRFDVYPSGLVKTDYDNLNREVSAILQEQFQQLDHIEIGGRIEQILETTADGNGTLYFHFEGSFETDPGDWVMPGLRFRFGGYSSHWTLADTLSEPTNSQRTISFSRDEDWLASGGGDNTVHIYETTNFTRSTTISVSAQVESSSWTGDNELCIGLANGDLHIYDSNNNWAEIAESPLSLGTNPVYDSDTNPDGSLLATGTRGDSSEVLVYDTVNWTQIAASPLTTPTNQFTSVQFSHDGAWLGAGFDNGDIRIWDTSTWSQETDLTTSNNVFTVEWSHDSQWLLGGNSTPDAYIWSVGDWTQETTWSPTGGIVLSGAWHQQDSHLALGGNGQMLIYEEGTWTEIAESPLNDMGSWVRECDFRSSYLAAASDDSNNYLYNSPSAGVAISVYGNLLGEGTTDGRIGRERAVTGSLTGSGTVDGAIAAQHSVEGDLLGTGTVDGTPTVDHSVSGDLLGDGDVAGHITFGGGVTHVPLEDWESTDLGTEYRGDLTRFSIVSTLSAEGSNSLFGDNPDKGGYMIFSDTKSEVVEHDKTYRAFVQLDGEWSWPGVAWFCQPSSTSENDWSGYLLQLTNPTQDELRLFRADTGSYTEIDQLINPGTTAVGSWYQIEFRHNSDDLIEYALLDGAGAEVVSGSYDASGDATIYSSGDFGFYTFTSSTNNLGDTYHDTLYWLGEGTDRPIYGSLVGTGTVDGRITLSASTQILLYGDLTASGTVEGAATVDHSASGDLTGEGTVDGAIATQRAVYGSLSGDGMADGAIVAQHSVEGDLLGSGDVEGAIAAQRSVSGDLLGSGDVSGAIQRRIGVEGTLLGGGSVAGHITADHRMSGDLLGTATLDGRITLSAVNQILIYGNLTASGSVEGTAVVDHSVSGSLSGDGTAEGSISAQRGVSGDLLGSGDVEGSASVAHSVSGDLLGTGTVEGVITGAVVEGVLHTFSVHGVHDLDRPTVQGVHSIARPVHGVHDLDTDPMQGVHSLDVDPMQGVHDIGADPMQGVHDLDLDPIHGVHDVETAIHGAHSIAVVVKGLIRGDHVDEQ